MSASPVKDKVWVVEYGFFYEDSIIAGIFSTEDKAVEFINKYNVEDGILDGYDFVTYDFVVVDEDSFEG